MIVFTLFVELELAQSPVPNDGTLNFLNQHRLKYAKNLISGHLNINSIKTNS